MELDTSWASENDPKPSFKLSVFEEVAKMAPGQYLQLEFSIYRRSVVGLVERAPPRSLDHVEGNSMYSKNDIRPRPMIFMKFPFIKVKRIVQHNN